MSILRYFKKLQLIDSLIRRKATGNGQEFARKIGMSKSMLNEYLKEMKEMGFPIHYCRKRNCYYYEQEGALVKSLFESKMEKEELKRYTGGNCLLPEDFLDLLSPDLLQTAGPDIYICS
jgi:biotin operon repressor